MLRLMQKLCSTETAMTILHVFSGLYNSVPPELSRHLNRDFITPKQRSMTLRVLECAALYAVSDGVVAFDSGVSNHGCSG